MRLGELGEQIVIKSDRMSYVRGDIYITKIIDEEMKRTDERLQ